MKFPFKIVDLTHTLSAQTPFWSDECAFSLKTLLTYEECDGDVKFCTQSFEMRGGIGTHIDVPAHCFAGKPAVHEIPLEQLCKPCVVIDVQDRAHASYLLSVEDIKNFEAVHGALGEDVMVLVKTGWSRFWDDASAYRNDMKFPSVSREAGEYLLSKNIAGLGIDTLSPDLVDSGFPVHGLLLGANKFIVENVANLDQMPSAGAFCLVAPFKVEGATEAPVRLIGFIPKEG